jgi:hypothetical protein
MLVSHRELNGNAIKVFSNLRSSLSFSQDGVNLPNRLHINDINWMWIPFLNIFDNELMINVFKYPVVQVAFPKFTLNI